MELRSMPEQFSPVFGELIYRYGQGNAQIAANVFEAQIFGGTPPEPMGIKRFPAAAEIDVNVAGYLRRKLSPKPVVASGSGFYEDAGRTVKCTVLHNGLSSSPRIFTAALENLSAGQILTRLPLHREISRNERDEISFVTEGGLHRAVFEVRGGRQMSFTTATYAASEGICTFVADMGWVMARVEQAGGDASGCRSVHVRIFGGEQELAHVVYVLRDNCAAAQRLCWLNSLGGIDSFTFQTVVSEQVRAAKERIILESGYSTACSAAERIVEINSGYQPQAVLAGLSEITLSSKVWVCRYGEFVPVDVMSESAVMRSDELGNLRLKVRDSAIVNYQTF